MSELNPAVITLARARTSGHTVHLAGCASPAGSGYVEHVPTQLEAQLRAAAHPGDALIVVGAPGGAEARDRVLRRAPAWGLEAIWIGTADDSTARPADGLARCVESADPATTLAELAAAAARFTGAEPELVPQIPECTDEVCVTCSDEGRLGEVVTPPEAMFLPAVVRTADGEEEVDTTLVGEVRPGDLVLIHAGGAIARVPEPELPLDERPASEELEVRR